MLNYLEDALENLGEALDHLQEQTEKLERLKRSGHDQEQVSQLELLLLEEAIAVRYLLQKCNSIMEGDFEVVDLLRQ